MDQFNSKHIAFLILGTSIVSLKTYIKVFSENGGRESWIAMIISSILILLFLIYVIKICQKNNTFSLIDIYLSSMGNTIGKLLLFFFCLTLFLTLVESAAVEASAMHTNMLLDTPIWFFILFFVGPAIYTIKQDVVGIITVALIGVTLIIIAGINLAMLTQEYKDYRFLLPIFENGITKGFILSILQTLGLYGSVSIIFPYMTLLKEKKKLLRHLIISLLFVIQMQIVSIIGALTSFEVTRVNSIPYVKLLQTQLVSHFRFMEAGELFVMLQVVGGWYIKYVVTFYALIHLLKAFKFNTSYFIYVISAFVAVAAYFAANNLIVLFRLLDYYTYITLVNFVLIPFLVFTIYSFKGQRATSKNV